jgi:hypothetical protein
MAAYQQHRFTTAGPRKRALARCCTPQNVTCGPEERWPNVQELRNKAQSVFPIRSPTPHSN